MNMLIMRLHFALVSFRKLNILTFNALKI